MSGNSGLRITRWPPYSITPRPPGPAGTPLSGTPLKHVGIDILAQAIGDSRELELIRQGKSASRFVRRALSQPMLALLRAAADAHAGPDEIHLMSMMAEYWLRLSETIAEAAYADVDVVREFGGLVADRGLNGSAVKFDDLLTVRALSLHLPTDRPATRDRCLRALVSHDVLTLDGDVVLPSQKSQLLWGFLMAQAVGAGDRSTLTMDSTSLPNTIARLVAWDAQGVAAAAPCMRFILLAAASLPADDAATCTRVFRELVQDCGLPLSVVWETAVASPPDVQYALMSSYLGRRAAEEESFWAIRLVRLLPTMSPAEAIDSLQYLLRVRRAAASLGLADYLLSAIVHCLNGIRWGEESDEVDQALLLLNRVGIDEIAQDLVDEVLRRVTLSTEDECRAWLLVLTSLAAKVSGRERDEPRGLTQFWELLVDDSLKAIGRVLGPPILNDMIYVGWYSTTSRRARRETPVASALRQMGHVAFGHTYNANPEYFIELLDALLRHDLPGMSPDLQAAAALYGIRHTVPTGGSVAHVSPRFAKALAVLAKDRSLSPRDRVNLLRVVADGPDA